jgi:ketol-acid reductoisomerase
MSGKTKIYFEGDGDLSILENKTVGVIGFGNQGRAQALNMRDSGVQVIIGNEAEEQRYTEKALSENFTVHSISATASMADVLVCLLPDEVLPGIFEREIRPHLRTGACLIFASGYNIAFDLLSPPGEVDVGMIAPRMIGVGVRETYLSGEGFYSFISLHRDATGRGMETLLACAKAVGTLKKGAVAVSMKEEALLDLYNEQAFGPAFGRVLLNAIDVLLSNGLPPEAVLIEMYLSGEMSYTYQKMAQVGLVNQLSFHSQTSQNGAMSRGFRYLGLPLKEKFQQTFDEINSGEFAREWKRPLSRMKFRALKFFATRQRISRIERDVRKNLRLPEFDTDSAAEDIERLLKNPELQSDLNEIRKLYEAE